METIPKKEVSNRVMQGIIDSLIEKKFDMKLFLEGIPYDLEYLQNRHERIEWWVYCKIISNLRPYFTQADFEDMCGNLVKRGKYFQAVIIGFFLFGSNRLARTFSRQIWKLLESQFSNIKAKTEFLHKNKMKIYAILDEGYEFPAEFAYFTKGTWDEMATLIGRKDFKVDFYITKQVVTFNVSWDKEGLFYKVTRVIRWFFNIKRALFEMTDTHAEMHQRYNQLHESQLKLEKQTTQLKTAYEISTSIKQSLDIKDTLEAIANTLVEESELSAVFIELFKDIDEKDFEIKIQAGVINELMTPIHHQIVVNEKHIGDLIAYPNLQMSHKDVGELVDYLMPVINIAIYNALVLRAIVDYRNNLEQKVSERTIELQTARDDLESANVLLKEAQLIQNRFFANISHEFRTPLTLMLGPAKNVLESTQEPKTKQNVSLIKRNAGKLLMLVNQLLDISKIESGNMKLQTIPMNIIPLLKGLVLSFSSYAERKRITLKFITTQNEIIVYLDTEKFEKIITNILSNALKFTPEGGRVEVTCHPEVISGSTLDSASSISPKIPNQVRDDNFVKIAITDNGIGIPADRIDKIFDRFYQVDGSHTREHEGTGIGLSLTKELIELHKGKIEVESEPGKGSTFTVSLPLGKDHLSAEEICEENLSELNQQSKVSTEEDLSEIIFTDEAPIEKQDIDLLNENWKPVLLVVEDNSDVRTYIKENLKTDFSILEAADGEDGLKKCIDYVPDLIVSDIMMPKMDGFKLCEQIKTNELTSHIPVILLTAKAAKEDKLSGYELGADEYLMKPFDTDELKSRIKNLITQRKRLQEHFRIKGFTEIDTLKITPVDKKFLEKCIEIINQHISDSEFSVDLFAEELFLSHSGLQKKILSLTGETPRDLLRKIRLNKAAELIKNKFGNISEIALEVGYNNPAHFSEAFKRQFGVLPSQYHQNNRTV